MMVTKIIKFYEKSKMPKTFVSNHQVGEGCKSIEVLMHDLSAKAIDAEDKTMNNPGNGVLLTFNDNQGNAFGLLFNSSVGLKIPGGAVEVHETYAQSAARELEEELFNLLKKHFNLDTRVIAEKLENARYVELISYKNKDQTDAANDQIEFIHRDYVLHLNDITPENIDNAYQSFIEEFNFLARTCAPMFGAIIKVINSDAIKSGELAQVKLLLTAAIENEYQRIANAFSAYYAMESNSAVKAILPGLDKVFNQALTYIKDLEKLDNDPLKRVRSLQIAILHNNLGDYTQLSAVVVMPLAEIEKFSIEAMEEANRHKLPVKNSETAQTKWEPRYKEMKLFPTSFAAISGIIQILQKEHTELFTPKFNAASLPTFANNVSSSSVEKTVSTLSKPISNLSP